MSSSVGAANIPRRELRKVLRHHFGAEVGLQRNVELTVYIEYLLFLKRLAQLSSQQAQQEGYKVVQDANIKAAASQALEEFKL